tara:strand:+ start:69 stop:311 length:243 start_codon:yes stop_codon:yes gene_type:complete
MKITLVLLILLGCSTEPKKTPYELHQIALEEYLNKTDLRGTPHSDLQEMWRTVYMESMIQSRLPTSAKWRNIQQLAKTTK